MTARFGEGGLSATSRAGTIHLRLGAAGRAGAEDWLPPLPPALGASVPGLEGPDGASIRRLEYAHTDLTEWFVLTPAGIEHGWTLDERPEGIGTLRFILETDATLLGAEAEASTWMDSAGAEWRYDDPSAFDANGEPLAIRFVTDGDELVVEVDDTGATYPIEIDPVLTTADLTLTGSAASSQFGYAVSTAGDVNDDGYEDVIVGARAVSGNTGRAYVYHGSASGLSSTATTTLTGGTSSGSTPYYYCGGRVAGGGDVNGDGFDDVAMACTFSTATVKVFHGSASGVSSTASSSFTSTNGTNFGYGVAIVPSVDGDAFDDLLIGAPLSASRGRVWAFPGSAAGLSGSSTVTLDGSSTSYFGLSIHTAGDVDGDSYNDVVIGAPAYGGGYGRASVYYGSSRGLTSAAVDHLTGGVGDAFGTGIAGGGDLNGDGYDDVAVGIYSPGTGRADIHLGSSAGITTVASASLTGSAYFGATMAMLSDMDDDGYADLAIGATGTDVGVYRGSASGLSTTAITTLTGTGTYFGWTLDGADVDGDGYTDLVVGNYVDSTTYGKAYVYMGYADADEDGYGGGGAEATDCNDGDATVFPGATESAGDGIDQDCDGSEDCFVDNDDDGYLDGSGTTAASTDADCTDANEGSLSDPTTDCDDADASIHAGATEVVGDETDQDCDTTEICYNDGDSDRFLDSSGSTVSSGDTDCDDAGEGTATTATTDCDDADASINPDAAEGTGDEIDQDCDGMETCYADADADGYRTRSTVASLDTSCGGAGEASESTPSGDCDDGEAGVNPGEAEVCDAAEIDENCDGLANDASAIDATLWYDDTDADGYGDPSIAELACEAPSGSTDNADDCDPSDSAVSPAGTEVCGGRDEDCDGLTDDDDPSVSDGITLYTDADGDGYGDAGAPVSGCAPSGSVVDNADDCDDRDPLTNPAAAETTADGVDQDCNGGDVCHVDSDDDGYRGSGTVPSADLDCTDAGEAESSAPSDCDDDDAAVNPIATEIAGDGTDQDCNLLEDCYDNADNDGYRTSTTTPSSNLKCNGAGEADASLPDADCDDGDPDSYPGAPELTGDEIDEDCDGGEICFEDVDADGYLAGTTLLVSADSDCADAGEGSLTTATGDCDDSDPDYHPGATESDCADPNDYNCDGATGYDDVDKDGWAACEECNDGDATIFPGATEAVGDGVDQDCDGAETCFVDADGDGHRPDPTATIASTDQDCSDLGEAEGTAAADDCDDSDASVVPGAVELPADGVDQDCDGLETCFTDLDDDGYRADATTRDSSDTDCSDAGEALGTEPVGDCDDTDDAYYPGAAEADCEDPNDYNCDSSTGLNDEDGDGFGACEECDDSNAGVNPAAVEVCNDLDDDCSGDIDDNAADGVALHADNDGDTYGHPKVAGISCTLIPGYVTNGADCDDARSDVHPGGNDLPDDGIDQDCDGADATIEIPGDTGDSGDSVDSGDSGDSGEPARVGGLFGGCDSSGGTGLAVGGVLLAAMAGGRRRRH